MFAVKGMEEATKKGRDVRDVLAQVWRDECRYALGDDAHVWIRRKTNVLRAAVPKYSRCAGADEAGVKSGAIPTLGQVAHSIKQKFLSMGGR